MSEFPWDDYMNDYDPRVHGRGNGEPDVSMIIIMIVSIALFAIVMGIFLSNSEKIGEGNKQQVKTENTDK